MNFFFTANCNLPWKTKIVPLLNRVQALNLSIFHFRFKFQLSKYCAFFLVKIYWEVVMARRTTLESNLTLTINYIRMTSEKTGIKLSTSKGEKSHRRDSRWSILYNNRSWNRKKNKNYCVSTSFLQTSSLSFTKNISKREYP